MTYPQGVTDRLDDPSLDSKGIHRALVVGLIVGGYAATIGVRVSIGGFQPQSLMILFALSYVLVQFPASRWKTLRVGYVDYAALIYILVRVSTEILNAIQLDHGMNLSMASNTAYYFLVYVVARVAVNSSAELRVFLAAFASWSVIVSALAILQVSVPGAISSYIFKYTSSQGAASRLEDGRLTRATSLIGHWSALGGYLCCIVACIGVVLLLDKQLDRGDTSWVGKRRLLYTNLFLSGCGIAATFTGATILVALVLFMAIGLLLKVKTSAVIATGVALLALWFAFQDSIQSRLAVQSRFTTYLSSEYDWVPSTLAVRIHLWINESYPALLERPWTGWGQSVYTNSSAWAARPLSIVWPYPESEVAKSLVTTGIVGFLALYALLTVWVLAANGTRRELGYGVGRLLSILIVSLAFASVVNPYFTNQGVPSALWPMVGSVIFASRAYARNSGLHPSIVPARRFAYGDPAMRELD